MFSGYNKYFNWRNIMNVLKENKGFAGLFIKEAAAPDGERYILDFEIKDGDNNIYKVHCDGKSAWTSDQSSLSNFNNDLGTGAEEKRRAAAANLKAVYNNVMKAKIPVGQIYTYSKVAKPLIDSMNKTLYKLTLRKAKTQTK